jgi:hypothetical protein
MGLHPGEDTEGAEKTEGEKRRRGKTCMAQMRCEWGKGETGEGSEHNRMNTD